MVDDIENIRPPETDDQAPLTETISDNGDPDAAPTPPRADTPEFLTP
ncbi:MAG: hypothetical protein HQK55_07700, partial [Deltaproteobacteria bacterium]|nr:hypothetical protein [Deltaproteobacteria bacterium]